MPQFPFRTKMKQKMKKTTIIKIDSLAHSRNVIEDKTRMREKEKQNQSCSNKH